MKKPILLFDFSKVISGVGISHFLSAQRAQYCSIDAHTIRTIYKKHIHGLVCGTIGIEVVIAELVPFLVSSSTPDDLLRCAKTCPPISTKVQKLLGILSRTHRLIVLSDTYCELGPAIRKKLKKWDIQCFFSYEYGSKKSEKTLWQYIATKLPINDIVCFVDDKQENLNRAKEVGIAGLLFPDEEYGIDVLLKHIYSHTDRCILGGGASGILYGYFLQKYTNQSFIIFEKEKKSGGLMQSFCLGTQRYDLGGHALHDANTKIKDFLSRETGVIHDRQKRQAYIWYDGVHIPFPFQLHLWYLSPEKKKRCLESFLHAYVTNKGKKARNIDDYLRLQFGDEIYTQFLKPYNLKIWKTPLNRLTTNRTKRISTENIDTVLSGYLQANDENYGTNSFVNYPSQGGYEEYLRPFADAVSSFIKTETDIIAIYPEFHLIETNHGMIHYDTCISTIPLPKLLELSNIQYKPDDYEHLSLQIVAMRIKKTTNPKQRIYSHDSKYFFHKCVLNYNSSEYLRNQTDSLIQFESSYKGTKKIAQQTLEKNYRQFLYEQELIQNDDDILEIAHHTIPYGYPIQTDQMLRARARHTKKLISHNIFCLGRFGNREYINYDTVIERVASLFSTLEHHENPLI